MHKRMLSVILSVLLIFSTAFVSSAEGWATTVDGAESSGMAEENPDDIFFNSDREISNETDLVAVKADFGDMGLTERVLTASTDGNDTGEPSGEEAGSEAPRPVEKPKQEVPFVVKTGKGTFLGEYEDWNSLLAAFKEKGSLTEEYTVTVAEGAVVGTVLPSQAGLLKLEPEREYGVLLFSGKAVNMTCALSVGKAALCVADYSGINSKGNGAEYTVDSIENITKSGLEYLGTNSGYDEGFAGLPVNINTKGKKLTLNGTRNVGIVKGNSSATLDITGNVEVQGNLQTFKEVSVQGSLKLANNATGIKNLNIEKGTIYLTSGKKLTVTNVNAGKSGTLVYPEEAKIPVVKFSGIVQGTVQLKQMARKKGVLTEQFFAEGSKLLTASKAGAEQFLLFGDKQACYKKSSTVYAGTEAMQLYCGNTLLGTHAQWKDLVTQIKNRNEAGASYRAVFLKDYYIAGAFSMPAKGKYAGISLERCDSGKNVLIQSTGGTALTSNLTLGSGVHLQTKSISGALWKLTLAENAQAVSSGAIQVGNLLLREGASLQAGGKLTVKSQLEAQGSTELVLTLKKAAAIRDTKTGSAPVAVRMRDTRDNKVTLALDAILFTVTGNSRADQYCFLDADGREYTLYQDGKVFRVKGRRIVPVPEGEWSRDYL